MNEGVLLDTAVKHLRSLILKVAPFLLPLESTAETCFIPTSFYYKFDRHEVHTAVNQAFIILFKNNGYHVQLEIPQQYKNVAGRIDAFAENEQYVCGFEFDTGVKAKNKSIEKLVNLSKSIPEVKQFMGFLCIRGTTEFSKKNFIDTIKRINQIPASRNTNIYLIFLSSSYITKYQP